MPEDRCVCCGEVIPEGRQVVCPGCWAKAREADLKDSKTVKIVKVAPPQA